MKGDRKKAASAVLIELAMSVLRDPRNPPAEVAYLAVILGCAAWNRSLGVEPRAELLEQADSMLKSNPDFQRHFAKGEVEELLRRLQKEKERRFPQDLRQIVKCRMTQDGVVGAEWVEVGSG
jgi:hypothetical protein